MYKWRMTGAAVAAIVMMSATWSSAQDAAANARAAIAAIIPKTGWKIIAVATGDLNRDGVDDAAAVVEATSPDGIVNGRNFNDRYLIAVISTQDNNEHTRGGYVSGTGGKLGWDLIPPESNRDDPCLADPLASGGIEIARGTIRVVLRYQNRNAPGCGRLQGNNLRRFIFRHQNNRFELIGADRELFSPRHGGQVSVSINFSTRDMERKTPSTGTERSKIDIGKRFGMEDGARIYQFMAEIVGEDIQVSGVNRDAKVMSTTPNRDTSGKTAAVTPPDIEMVFVKGGKFTMGCTPEQGDDCNEDERPPHSVTVGDFSIGKYEVTQKQWVQIMGNNPSHFKGDNLPVESVSWSDVQEFISKLNAVSGKKYRLPTEAEWEYAARGGDKSGGFKYAGSNNIRNIAWYGFYGDENNRTSGETSNPVGTKQPNELGIYDMSGNVWEWVNDWYGAYTNTAKRDPAGSSSGSDRVLRGGGWDDGASVCRVSFRGGSSPDNRRNHIGFRLVLVP